MTVTTGSGFLPPQVPALAALSTFGGPQLGAGVVDGY